jgi:peptidoglycan/LPS O-acetylase OafA/YrhL
MLMLRLGRPAPLIFAFTIALAVTLWRVHLTLAGAGQWRLYMGLDTRLDAILVGCIGALTMRVTQIFAQKYPMLSQFIFLIAWLGLGTLVLNVSLFQRDFYLWALPIANVCCGIIVVGLECTPTRVVRRALAVKPLQILGRLSYVLYLWHFAFVLLNQRLMFVDPARIVLISASSLGLAVLTNLLVEQPAMNFGRRFRQSTPQAAAAP